MTEQGQDRPEEQAEVKASAEQRGSAEESQGCAGDSAEGTGEPASTAHAAAESVQAIGEEIEKLRQEVETLRTKYLRAVADYQNLQKRSAAQRAEAVREAQVEFARALLPVLDDFERTLQAATSTDNARQIAEGVRLVYENLLKVLSGFGVTQLPVSKGDPFDPLYHEAMAQEPSDEVPAGHILRVMRTGYRMFDRLLRPAQVIVAKDQQQTQPAEPPRPEPAQRRDSQVPDEAGGA